MMMPAVPMHDNVVLVNVANRIKSNSPAGWAATALAVASGHTNAKYDAHLQAMLQYSRKCGRVSGLNETNRGVESGCCAAAVCRMGEPVLLDHHGSPSPTLTPWCTNSSKRDKSVRRERGDKNVTEET